MLEPLRPEPYLYGLQLAQRLERSGRHKWSSLGILKQAWPKDKTEVVEQRRVARRPRCVEQLKADESHRRSRRVSGRSSIRPRFATAWSRSPGPAMPTST